MGTTCEETEERGAAWVEAKRGRRDIVLVPSSVTASCNDNNFLQSYGQSAISPPQKKQLKLEQFAWKLVGFDCLK